MPEQAAFDGVLITAIARRTEESSGRWIRSIDELTSDAISDKLSWGLPRECAEQIERWRDEVQMDTLLLVLRQAIGSANYHVLQVIRTLGEEVVPRLAEGMGQGDGERMNPSSLTKERF